MVDELGIVIAQRDSYPGLGNLPTSQWPLQTLIADPHQITIPTTTYAPAKLDIYMGLYDFYTGQRLPTNEGDRVYLQSFKLQSADDQGIPNPQYINFDDKIALRGYELDHRLLHPGDTLTLTIWWEALQDVEKNYKVFTHLLLPPDAVWAQDDQEPQEGQSPTSTWQQGDIVQDHYLLQVPENAPSDVYRIEVGLYGSEDGERLPVNFSIQGIPLGNVKVHR